MIETVTQTLGNHTYDITQLGALQGKTTLARLGSALAPMMSAGMLDKEVTEAAASIGSLFGKESAEVLDHLCEVFGKNTMVHLDGDKKVHLAQIFDQHFAGDYGAMTLWLAACLKVNFSNFFDGVTSGSLIASVSALQSP